MTRGRGRAAAPTAILLVVLGWLIWSAMQNPHVDMAMTAGAEPKPAVVSGSDVMPGGMSDGGSAVSVPTESEAMPNALAGLVRTEVVTGAEALAQVAHMHGAGVVAILDATIARYSGPDGRAEVWVGNTNDTATAKKLTTDMADGIARGRSPFAPSEWIAADRVWRTSGLGQVHYFFQRRHGVWWLSVDEDRAAAALAEVISLAEAP